MKISGRNIKRRLYGVAKLRDRMSRARYFRGHGVHSPFVYAIVRQVFMRKKLVYGAMDGEPSIFDALLDSGIPRKRAVQLANLYALLKPSGWVIDKYPESQGSFIVVSGGVATESLSEYAAEARKTGSTLVIMAPYGNRERDRACREIIAGHSCTTVDNRGYLLVFNNHLPKQHFRL